MFALRRAPGNPHEGRLAFPHGILRAALGRSGIKVLKREGDGGTPPGRLYFREVLYRPDRMSRPRTRLPVSTIRAGDCWCEDACSPNYNRRVKLARDSTADRLTRADHLYDLIVVLGYNDLPRVRGRGSAIFLHLAREGYAPTAGCIALSLADLTALLRHARPGGALLVVA